MLDDFVVRALLGGLGVGALGDRQTPRGSAAHDPAGGGRRAGDVRTAIPPVIFFAGTRLRKPWFITLSVGALVIKGRYPTLIRFLTALFPWNKGRFAGYFALGGRRTWGMSVATVHESTGEEESCFA